MQGIKIHKILLKHITLSFLLVAILCSISMAWIDWPLALFIKKHTPAVIVKLSQLGRPLSLLGMLLIPMGLSLWAFKKYMPKATYLVHPWLIIGASVYIGDILARISKMFIGRYRLLAYFSDGLSGFSPMQVADAGFPSGSTTRIIALVVGLWIFFPKHKGLWIAIAIFVLASRLLTQAHFLSDVIMGAWLGTAVTSGLYALTQKTRH